MGGCWYGDGGASFSLVLERRKLLFIFLPVFLSFVGYLFIEPEAVVRKGLTYRDVIWLEHFKDINGVWEWLFGKGLLAPTNFVVLPGGKLAPHTHSIYVEVLYKGGLIGFVLLLFFIVSVLYCLVSMSKKRKELSFAGAVLVGLFVSMVFDFHSILIFLV